MSYVGILLPLTAAASSCPLTLVLPTPAVAGCRIAGSVSRSVRRQVSGLIPRLRLTPQLVDEAFDGARL